MTPCPNCPSTALGNELISACTECASVSVAGASVNMTALVAAAALSVAVFFAVQALGRLLYRAPRSVAA